MARYEITGPDGGRYEVTAPDSATEQEILAYIQSQSKAVEPQMGGVEAGVRGALQGVTLGLSDEIYGAGRGALSWAQGKGYSDEYNTAVKEARAGNKRAASQQPWAYYGGEVAGGVALPLGGARVAARLPEAAAGVGRTLGFGQLSASAGKGLGARTVAGAREGAAYGAAYGFGQGEGGVENRMLSSASGALVGGSVGAAVPGLVDAGSAVVRGASTPLRAALQPQQVGREKMAEALLRDVSGEAALTPSYDEALTRINSRLVGSQLAGKPAMLADAGGENTRNLLRAATNQQSTGAETLRKTLDRRQAGQWNRIEGDLAKTMGDGREFYQAVDDLAAQRAANAAPAFQRAYSAPWNVKADDPLAQFLTERGYMRRIVEKAQENIEGMTGQNSAELRPWEFLHRVKMEIDREISRVKRGQQDAKASWTLRDLVQLKNEMKGHIDTHNKAFGQALRQYGDESGLINAAEDGFDGALKLAPEEIRKTIAKLSREEADMYRVGAARAIVDKVRQGNVTRDRTENVFGSPDMQMRLRAIMPDVKTYRKFQRSLVMEAKMADTRKAVQGNSTTAKQLAQADEAGQAMRPAVAAAQAATGRLEPLLNYLGRQAQRFSGITPSTADAIIRAAMEKNPSAVRTALAEAMQHAENAPAARAMVAQALIAGHAGVQSAPDQPTR